jgi:hypothetical protein
VSEAFGIQAHLLQFDCRAETSIRLNAGAGGQIRGALWSVLSKMICPDPSARSYPEHQQHCPLCRLMHLETVSARGMNPVRPFAIRPPLNPRIEQPQTLEIGQDFHFQIVLFGEAVGYIPYIVQAVYRAGHSGIGTGKGRFRLVTAKEINPFTKAEAVLYRDGTALQPSTLSVSSVDVYESAQQLDDSRVALHFLTPMQITATGRTSQNFHFSSWIARLLERCQALESTYGIVAQSHEVWRERHFKFAEVAQNVKVERDDTRWVDVWSRSGRTEHLDNIGGLVGTLTLTGNITFFRSWITYGQLLHVGKNAVKGNGWYTIMKY